MPTFKRIDLLNKPNLENFGKFGRKIQRLPFFGLLYKTHLIGKKQMGKVNLTSKPQQSLKHKKNDKSSRNVPCAPTLEIRRHLDLHPTTGFVPGTHAIHAHGKSTVAA
eukprot:GHVT01093285.1.p1 GENE.GHVT01093285.1~~GHVT01093285.1.p1  ORF type:complete len:108 (+),score=7.13 GHVT01093285.1:605-928(+)